MTANHLSLCGDSGRGQGSRSDRALRGLSLRPVGIATNPRTGALSADLRLKHLSAKGAALTKGTRPQICENGQAAAKNDIARQRGNGITL